MPPLDAAQANDWVTVPAPAAAAKANDWVTVPPASSWAAPPGGEFGDLAEPSSKQDIVGAGINAGLQGAVGGVGGLIAGAGDIAKAGDVPWAKQVLSAFDLVDEGKNRDAYQKLSDAQRQQVGAYRGSSADDRAAQRASLQQTIDDYSKPNLAQRAGSAVEQASTSLFPVDPAQEGTTTGTMRMVGGIAPLMAAGTLGGPVGIAASAAAIGAQVFHGTRADAIANGASPEEADDAAGKSALANIVTMSVPISRVIPMIPVPLREGFVKTLVNVGQQGAELGAGNTLGTMASNYVAQQTYDPDRSVFKGTGDAGIDGFLAGLVIHGVGAGVGASRAEAARIAPSEADAATARFNAAYPELLNPTPKTTFGDGWRPAATVDDVTNASTLDGAIAAANRVASTPGAGGTAAPVARSVGSSASGFGWGQLFGSAPTTDSFIPATMTTSSGQKVPFRWDVAEAGDLTPASGDLQPRDRAGRMSSAGQIVNMASNLDPELLHASPGPDQGAPTVNADGVILAGNGRTRAIQQAYALGNADPYRAMIERYGFDTSGMDAPMLIRRIEQQTPEQDRQLAVDSNTSAVQRMSGTEQAAVDAGNLTPDLLSKYNPLLIGGPAAAGNRDFVRAWVATLPQSERNGVQTGDGSLSADGVRRLQGAMLSLAYGDKGTLSRSLESTDDTTRALTGALTDAAPAWAQLQTEIAAGRVPASMNVAAQLTRAVDLVRQAREKGQTGADVLSQADAFNPIDPVTEAFVRAFYNPTLTRAAARPLVAEVLRRYATEAAKTSASPGLFGDAEPALAPADILGAVSGSARADPPVVPTAEPVPQSVGAAASRDTTAQNQIAAPDDEFAANRLQGEVERLAAPPKTNDKTEYVPGVKSTLAEVTGDPVASMDQAYNRQQPEALTQHLDVENKTADLVAAYYADTAGSAPTLLRMERARDARAAKNIQEVFGDPDSTRPPADPSPTITTIQAMLDNPRQAERSSVIKVLSSLAEKFYSADGKLKTDPYALYGIGEHINDLLRGAGDTETSSAARVLKRELVQIKDSLYQDIEGAAPGFAKYRDEYQRDSRAIDAMKLLQDERLPLLSGTRQHITPAKWFSFMRGIVEGRADPMDPASSLSEDQMDRLWNITDQLKRSTFIDIGKPRGSWTSMMQEWGGRFGRLAAHGIAASTFPVVGNLAVEMGVAGLRKRNVRNEMNRVLNPDLGQQAGP